MKTSTTIIAIVTTVVLLLGAGMATKTFGAAANNERVITITARAFEYEPNRITLKKGEPAMLELTSKDLFHGFNIPELGLRADLPPGKTMQVRITPEKRGTFEFHCDNFCGTGHESMTGIIVVE